MRTPCSNCTKLCNWHLHFYHIKLYAKTELLAHFKYIQQKPNNDLRVQRPDGLEPTMVSDATTWGKDICLRRQSGYITSASGG